MASASSDYDRDEIEDRLERFLQKNFPQIEMHGGYSVIEEMDPEAGEVSLGLGGACSGCGISPMTVQAIKKRLPKELPMFTTVNVTTEDTSTTELGEGVDGSSSPF